MMTIDKYEMKNKIHNSEYMKLYYIITYAIIVQYVREKKSKMNNSIYRLNLYYRKVQQKIYDYSSSKLERNY